MVEHMHYAGGASKTRVYLHGLFHRGDDDLKGVIWWLPPTIAAARKVFPSRPNGVLSLSRLVVAPGVPKNAATFLIAASIKRINADRWPCLLTYADTWQGHKGGIYRASNWTCLGETEPHRIYVDPAGKVISKKIWPKTRSHSEMLRLGATCLGAYPKIKFMKVIGNAGLSSAR